MLKPRRDELVKKIIQEAGLKEENCTSAFFTRRQLEDLYSVLKNLRDTVTKLKHIAAEQINAETTVTE